MTTAPTEERRADGRREPLWKHACPGCVFLGSWEDSEGVDWDMYVHVYGRSDVVFQAVNGGRRAAVFAWANETDQAHHPVLDEARRRLASRMVVS